MSVLESPTHKQLALGITRESIVLLKNENNFLPLKKNLKKVTVIGPNADNKVSVLGNYNGFPTHISTPFEAIKSKLKNSNVVYEKGIEFVDSTAEGNEKIASLVEKLKGNDVVIFVGGISPELEGEEMPVNIDGFTGGDRTSIKLPTIQTKLLQALHAENIPTVFVMMTGSAIAMEWESENLPAIVNAWYGGQDAGTAIADVLFGDYNPAGRLPVTFYAKDSDLPTFNSYEMKNRTYRFFTGEVLYLFGYGLSYTTFQYDNIRIPNSISTSATVEVVVNVKNTGKMAGDEVVQLYLTYPEYNNAPIYALKGFERIHLKSGESKDVIFKLTPRELGLVNQNGILMVEEGKRELHIGGTSPTATSAKMLPAVQKTVDLVGPKYIVEQ